MRLIYGALAWLFWVLMVVGFGGSLLTSAYLLWINGFDSGAVFSLRTLRLLSQFPVILVLGAVGFVGAVGLKMVVPHSSYAAKKKP